MIAWAKNVANQDMEEKNTDIKDIMEKDTTEADIVKGAIMDAAVQVTAAVEAIMEVVHVDNTSALADSTTDGGSSSLRERRSRNSKNTERN